MFPDINKLQLKSSNAPILKTVDEPIKDYMETLVNDTDAFKKISKDFKDIRSVYYSNKAREQFNLYGKRSWSVMLNASLHIKNYYETVENPEEKKVLEEILSALSTLWESPQKFSKEAVVNKASKQALAWITLDNKSGGLHKAQSALQAFLILSKVALISLENQNLAKAIVTRGLIMPSEPKKRLKRFIEAITQAYPKLEAQIKDTEEKALMLTIEHAATPIKALESITEKEIKNIDNKIQTIAQNKQKMHEKLAVLTEFNKHLNQSEYTSHSFFSFYDTEEKLNSLLNALEIPEAKWPDWHLSLNAHTSSGRSYLASNLRYYTSGLTSYVVGASGVSVNKKLLTSMLSSVVRQLGIAINSKPEALIGDILATLTWYSNSTKDEDELNTKKSQLISILEEARKLPAISIIYPPQEKDLLVGLLDDNSESTSTMTENKVLKEYITGSIDELRRYNTALSVQKNEVESWLEAVNKIQVLISSTNSQSMDAWFKTLVDNVLNKIIPTDSQTSLDDVTNTNDKLTFMKKFHDDASKESQKLIDIHETTLNELNTSNAQEAIKLLNKHIQSINPTGFWTRLLMFFSPSYKRCLQATQEALENYKKSDPKQQPIDCLDNINSILLKGQKDTKGWIGAFPVAKLNNIIEPYRLFTPAPSDAPEPCAISPIENYA